MNCHSPLLEKDGARLGDGGELDGPGLLLADPAVGAEQHLDADRHVVLPQQQHVLPKILIFLALKNKMLNT